MRIVVFLFIFLVSGLRAENDLQFSGFGTLGVVNVNSDVYGYRQDISQEDGSFDGELELSSTSILGLQLDYAASTSFDLVYQAVYRNQNEITLDTVSSLAFIRYSPSPTWSYRLGRTPLDLFLLTEFRDVGFAYTWAHTPTEVYGLVPYRYLDGGDVSFNTNFNQMAFRAKLFMGISESDFSGYKTPEAVKLDDILGLSFSLESFNWSLQTRFSKVKVVDDVQSTRDINTALYAMTQNVPGFDFIWPGAESLISLMTIENAEVKYFSFGGRYETENWDFMGEFSLVRSDREVIPDLQGGYASIIYHTNEHSFYGIYALTNSDNFNIDELGISTGALSMVPGGMEVYYAVDAQMNFYASNQTTTSLGWRWNFSDSIALKLQWDHTQVDEKGGTLWQNKSFINTPERSINSIFTNLSFIF